MNEKFMVKKEGPLPAEVDHIAWGDRTRNAFWWIRPRLFFDIDETFFNLATGSSMKSKYGGNSKRHRLAYKVSHFLRQNNLGFFA